MLALTILYTVCKVRQSGQFIYSMNAARCRSTYYGPEAKCFPEKGAK